MKKIVRWLRGATGIGLTWAGLWILVGLIAGVTMKIFQPEDIGPGESNLPRLFAIFGTIGFLSGVGFAAVLSAVEHRRTLRQLSLSRVAVWGALGAGVIPFVIGANASMGIITGGLGGLFAAGTLALARRSANNDPQLHDSDTAPLLGAQSSLTR